MRRGLARRAEGRVHSAEGTEVEMSTKPGFGRAVLAALALAAFAAAPALAGGGGGKPADRKVSLCHVPPGNPDARHTIEVGTPALDAHLDHGDWIGACGPGFRDRGRARGRGREGRGRERDEARDERERERGKAQAERERERDQARDERQRERAEERDERERERTREARKRDESWHDGWRDTLQRELGRLREQRDAEIERIVEEAGGGTPEEVEEERAGILSRYLEQVRKLQEDYLDGPVR
jgi:hypothetical protein